MDELVAAARDARDAAYAPYSGFGVGAAVETGDGSVYRGANVENVNYSNSLHAEEVAVGKAVVEGHTTIRRVAVSAGEKHGLLPCGMCRQTLDEFCDEDATVIADEGPDDEPSTYRLGDLLPDTMAPTDLNGVGDAG